MQLLLVEHEPIRQRNRRVTPVCLLLSCGDDSDNAQDSNMHACSYEYSTIVIELAFKLYWQLNSRRLPQNKQVRKYKAHCLG